MSLATTSSTRSTSTTTATVTPTSRTSSTSETENTIPTTFLYNVGPIESLTSPNWNRRQFYSVTRVTPNGCPEVLAQNVPCPPCNIGPLSTPNYADAGECGGVSEMSNGRMVFAGQRAEAFFVDLGAIFDLGDLRPIANLHNTFMIPNLTLAAAPGVNSLASSNVHSIAIQVPITDIAADGVAPTNSALASSSVGVWTTASRQKARVLGLGPRWQRRHRAVRPGLATGQPALQRGARAARPRRTSGTRHRRPRTSSSRTVSRTPSWRDCSTSSTRASSPNLAAYTKPRADLEAILLTGIPAGVVSPDLLDVHGRHPGRHAATQPRDSSGDDAEPMGILGGDVAGLPQRSTRQRTTWSPSSCRRSPASRSPSWTGRIKRRRHCRRQ